MGIAGGAASVVSAKRSIIMVGYKHESCSRVSTNKTAQDNNRRRLAEHGQKMVRRFLHTYKYVCMYVCMQ